MVFNMYGGLYFIPWDIFEEVLENPFNTFKFTNNKIAENILVFEPPYKGIFSFSIRGTYSTYPSNLS